MNEKPKGRAVQVGDLIERIERLEALLTRHLGGQEVDDLDPPARGGDEEKRVCSLPDVPLRQLDPGISRERESLIRNIEKKWVNGTKLRYAFFTSGPNAGGSEQLDLVREGFEVWKNVGIGIEFQEIRDLNEAEVRIGFLQGDGAWSYVGRDVINVPRQNERTMNFGWDLTRDSRREYVAVHEIGHTLGFPHEHQNPFSGIVWDEEAVYRHFGAPPNSWPRSTTFFNILRKLSQGEVEGTSWDPDSIMHYAFEAGLILQPAQYRNGLSPHGGLSQKDIDQVRLFYPPLDPQSGADLKVGRSEQLGLAPAEQKNFVIKPDATRDYTIQTLGLSDTLMVLFEDQNGDLKFVAGDDDSGTDLNARIVVRLYKGRRYVLRVRLYSSAIGGNTAVSLS